MKSGNKKYDLEKQTFVSIKNVIEYVRKLPKGITYSEIGKQLIRSAGSVAANYIEANESLSKKDFIIRIKICKKEAKESHYWLNPGSPTKNHECFNTENINNSYFIVLNYILYFVYNLNI